MISKVRALFPIEGDGFRIELVDLDERFQATIRVSVFEDGALRDMKEQSLQLLPPQARDERGLEFLRSSAVLARELTNEAAIYRMPMDFFHTELLGSDLVLDVEALRRIEENPRAQHAFAVEDSETKPHRWTLRALIPSLDPARRPAPPQLVNEALEAAIRERPDDRSAYSVYGDWLAERGDPRGELVAVQCALADRPGDEELCTREQRILDEYAYELLGGLAWRTDVDVGWRYGFPSSIQIGHAWGERASMWDGPGSIAACRAQRLVGELVIAGFSEDATYDRITEAIGEGLPHGLRSLRLVVEQYAELGDFEPAYPALAALEELSIEARAAQLGEIELPALRSFELITRGLTVENLRELRAARWPKLERFAIAPGDHGVDNCDVTLDDLDWLLAGELPVKHLGLLGTWVEEVLERLASSEILPRLVTLDLSRGHLRDHDVVRRYAEQLAHLEKLVLPARVEVPGVRVEYVERFIPVYE